MRYRNLLCLCFIICCLAGGVLGHAAPQGGYTVQGRVVLEPPGRVPRFAARLYFPREARRPPLVTFTDDAGRFIFYGLPSGRYLLELYQGNALVYQSLLALPGNENVLIRLRAR